MNHNSTLELFRNSAKKTINSVCDLRENPNVHNYQKYISDINELRAIIDTAIITDFPKIGIKLMEDKISDIERIFKC